MTTIHDEEKIKELCKLHYIDYFTEEKATGESVEIVNLDVRNAMMEYADFIRKKTIDECIACANEAVVIESWVASDSKTEELRNEIITNLNQLKK